MRNAVVVTLREVREEDLGTLYEHQADPEAVRIGAIPSREREAFFAHWRTKVLADPGVVARAIVADGVLAGNVVSWAAGAERMVGYVLGREHWGKGIASQALAQLLRIDAFRPLHARVVAQNVASVRVLEKCGFVRIGEDRQGELRDLVYRLD